MKDNISLNYECTKCGGNDNIMKSIEGEHYNNDIDQWGYLFCKICGNKTLIKIYGLK